jgi:hypothetical protein
MSDFKKLHVWQKAHALSLSVDRVCKRIRDPRYASLKSQAFRAAMSIPANIAEGRRKNSRKISPAFSATLSAPARSSSIISSWRGTPKLSGTRFRVVDQPDNHRAKNALRPLESPFDVEPPSKGARAHDKGTPAANSRPADSTRQVVFSLQFFRQLVRPNYWLADRRVGPYATSVHSGQRTLRVKAYVRPPYPLPCPGCKTRPTRRSATIFGPSSSLLTATPSFTPAARWHMTTMRRWMRMLTR